VVSGYGIIRKMKQWIKTEQEIPPIGEWVNIILSKRRIRAYEHTFISFKEYEQIGILYKCFMKETDLVEILWRIKGFNGYRFSIESVDYWEKKAHRYVPIKSRFEILDIRKK